MPENEAVVSAPAAKVSLPRLDSTPLHPQLHEQLVKDVRLMLIFWRLLNVLVATTFFQPDEYFQLQEPAWNLAFGKESGAWITWEWQHQLRSSLHPALFAAFYMVAKFGMDAVHLFPQFQMIILRSLPNAIQAGFAVIGDIYSWKLAEKIYGQGSNTAWVAHLMTMASPWMFFACTRTFSNSLETVLTIVALYYWPWSMASDGEPVQTTVSGPGRRRTVRVFETWKDVMDLRSCLILAGVACILRPTNLLIWVSVATLTITRLGLSGKTLAAGGDLLILIREVLICGSLVIGVSAVSDYLYFGFWTFPPYNWLNFNINQSLAVFYGVNDWHYYISQGLPLLLTSYLPWGLIALWSSTSSSASQAPFVANVRFILSFTVLATVAILSLVAHKEVRFIFPLLPLLHIISAPHVYSFFSGLSLSKTLTPSTFQSDLIYAEGRKHVLWLLVLFNLGLAIYTTQVHQRGVVSVVSYLRDEYAKTHLSNRGVLNLENVIDNFNGGRGGDDEYPETHDYSANASEETFAAFLMPCHSTPWRSHLGFSELKAWALTCEPPLHTTAGSIERQVYRDEADRFYDDPLKFLKQETSTKERAWPRYIVGFEGIEEVLKTHYAAMMPGWQVRRRKSFFNSHFHDDARRRGDVVVWEFVDPTGKV